MNPEVQKELLNRLDGLATKLGVTAQYLWTVLVHEAKVQGIEDVCIACLAFILIPIVWFVVRVVYKRDQKKNEGKDASSLRYTGSRNWEVCAGAATVLTVFMSIVSVSFAYGAVTELANPQYWALQQLLNTIK